jgi:hypothetical protein
MQNTEPIPSTTDSVPANLEAGANIPDASPDIPEPEERRRAGPLRTISLVLLTIVSGIALLAANLLIWADRTVIDRDEFVETVDQTLAKPEVDERIASVITTQIVDSPQYKTFIDENLPSQAAALEPLVRGRARPFIEDAVQTVLSSELIGSVRNGVLGRLHDQLLAFLENERGLTEFQGDALVLDMRDQVNRVLDRLGIDPPEALGGGEGQGEAGTIVLLEDASALRQASWFVQNRAEIIIGLIVLALLCFAAIVLLRRPNSRGFWLVGAIVLAVGLISLFAVPLTNLILGEVMPERIVLQEFVRELLGNLRWQSVVLAILGAIAMVLTDRSVRAHIGQAGNAAVNTVQRVDSTLLLAIAGVLVILLLLI